MVAVTERRAFLHSLLPGTPRRKHSAVHENDLCIRIRLSRSGASTAVVARYRSDDDGVIEVYGDRGMRSAPLGVVSGAVVGVVTPWSSG